MEKVLVTGCLGFIGHHLVRALKARGYRVFGVDNLSNGNADYIKECDGFWNIDAGDLVSEQLRGVKYVFHLAALPRVPYSIEHPIETHEVNVNETLRLLCATKEAGVQKFIFSSSSAVYGIPETTPTPEDSKLTPLSPYALQKLAAERYCELFREIYGMPTASLRYFNAYGEEQPADNPYTGVITRFLQLRKEEKPLTIYGTGLQQRDFTYVGDIVEANILAAEKGEGVYNVGTGVQRSILDVAQAISQNLVYMDARVGDPILSLADNTRLCELGWKPSQDVLEWVSKQL